MSISKNSYLADVTDDEFESFFGLSSDLYESQHHVESVPKFPDNAIKAFVDPLTRRINSQSRSKYNLVSSSLISTMHGPEDTKIVNLELKYHKSGAAYGKVVRAQIRMSREKPFIELFAAKVVGREPEDRLLLLQNQGNTVASWDKYSL